jgi:hypothetical protein
VAFFVILAQILPFWGKIWVKIGDYVQKNWGAHSGGENTTEILPCGQNSPPFEFCPAGKISPLLNFALWAKFNKFSPSEKICIKKLSKFCYCFAIQNLITFLFQKIKIFNFCGAKIKNFTFYKIFYENFIKCTKILAIFNASH